LLVELLGTESSQPWGVAPVLSWGEGNVVVRFLRLWAVGLAVHFAAWTIAYFLVPEGALRGVFLSSRLPLGESSWTAVAGRIVLYNVGVAAGLVAVANLFRVGRFPLGYAAVLAHWALWVRRASCRAGAGAPA